MNKQIKEKWIAALRSGKYEQGATYLYNPIENTFCCLGVLCELYDQGRSPQYPTADSHEFCPPPEVIDWAELNALEETRKKNPWTITPLPDLASQGDEVAKLADYNDSGRTFKWISSYIEKYL